MRWMGLGCRFFCCALNNYRQIWHGTTYGDERVFKGSAKPLLCTNTSTWFITDGWDTCFVNLLVHWLPVIFSGCFILITSHAVTGFGCCSGCWTKCFILCVYCWMYSGLRIVLWRPKADIFTLHAMFSGAAYCNRSCLCVIVCGFVYCGSVTMITRNCQIHQTGCEGEGIDRLHLIKFWPSCAPGKGVWRGNIFGSTLLQPTRSVCVSLSAFFIADFSLSSLAFVSVYQDVHFVLSVCHKCL